MSRYAQYQDLKIEVAAKVATVTLNRPEARNALDPALTAALPEAIAACDARVPSKNSRRGYVRSLVSLM